MSRWALRQQQLKEKQEKREELFGMLGAMGFGLIIGLIFFLGI